MDTPRFTGLSKDQVQLRQARDGYNELPTSKPPGIFRLALNIIREPMFMLLVICGSLYLVLGDIREGLMLMGFVFVIMGIEFYQEKKTEKALEALKELASPRALVIREGTEKRIPGREVVVDDMVVLQEGDRVPADGTVVWSVNLKADESLLTGESIAVLKRERTDSETLQQPGGDGLPYVFSGSMIVQGNGIVQIHAIGAATELGKIGKALESVQEEPTRLRTEMGVMVRRLTIIGISLCLIVILVFTITRGDLLKGFLAGITLAMAMLPEEFPVVLTIFMAVGAWRMSKKNVLTRKPSAVETLGSATVLCTDKTGTLTQNRMSVTHLYNGEAVHQIDPVAGIPEEFHEIFEYGMLSSQANPFDPMEKAITALGLQFLKDTEHIHFDWKMVREYPLSGDLLAMSRVFAHSASKQLTIAAKGAPEAIFDLCHLPPEEVSKYETAIGELAREGLRILGVAKSEIGEPTLPEIQHDFDFTFVGLIAFADPIRETVPEAVAECYKAGIRIIMITGDYPVTARNIARQIGLKNHEQVITGPELNKMSEETLCRKIREVNIFARVVPEQKLMLVNALKKNGEIVAMTGDGVNDAPALKSAHIGIAMGEKGTDVAREASSLVLMDDNFASIIGAVRMGRRIFDNLQKALGYIFAIHVPIAGLSLIPVFFANLPLLLWPVHIVFLELIIDPACSIIFEAEKGEKDVMNRPPKDINTPFFGAAKIWLSCSQGLGILVIVFAIYLAGLHYNYSVKETRALAFTTLIAANIAIILSNRSWTRSIFQILVTPNKSVKWVVGGAIFFLVLILNVPFLVDLFQFERISFMEALACAVFGFSSIIWFELYKWYNVKRASRSILS